MLGLSNAATPLGLRAMQDLEKLNPRPGTATNAMCTFLAINTSSIQLIPATTVALLAAAGSKNPTAIIGTAFFATCCSTLAGILAVKSLERLPIYALPACENPIPDAVIEDSRSEEKFASPKWWGNLALFLFAACFLWFGWNFIATAHESKSFLVSVVEAVSYLAIPFLIAFFPLYASLCRIPVYEESYHPLSHSHHHGRGHVSSCRRNRHYGKSFGATTGCYPTPHRAFPSRSHASPKRQWI
jgi:hypothetical protein